MTEGEIYGQRERERNINKRMTEGQRETEKGKGHSCLMYGRYYL